MTSVPVSNRRNPASEKKLTGQYFERNTGGKSGCDEMAKMRKVVHFLGAIKCVRFRNLSLIVIANSPNTPGKHLQHPGTLEFEYQ